MSVVKIAGDSPAHLLWRSVKCEVSLYTESIRIINRKAASPRRKLNRIVFSDHVISTRKLCNRILKTVFVIAKLNHFGSGAHIFFRPSLYKHDDVWSANRKATRPVRLYLFTFWGVKIELRLLHIIIIVRVCVFVCVCWGT